MASARDGFNLRAAVLAFVRQAGLTGRKAVHRPDIFGCGRGSRTPPYALMNPAHRARKYKRCQEEQAYQKEERKKVKGQGRRQKRRIKIAARENHYTRHQSNYTRRGPRRQAGGATSESTPRTD